MNSLRRLIERYRWWQFLRALRQTTDAMRRVGESADGASFTMRRFAAVYQGYRHYLYNPSPREID